MLRTRRFIFRKTLVRTGLVQYVSHDEITIIMWNQLVQTDRTIPNNKPDVTNRDNEKGTCMLMDFAISGDRNVT